MTDLKFLKEAFTDLRIGAVTTTSKYVIRKILRELNPKMFYAVEYGPGDGIITELLIERLPPDGRIAAIETNDSFVAGLKALNEPRLTVIQGNVVDESAKLRDLGWPRIDTVLSSVPLTYLFKEDREKVIKQTYEALPTGGQFIVWQYSMLVLPLLKKYFQDVRVTLEPRNLLPYFVMTASKK
jgi:phospholipid N-methyltransferase